MEKIKNKLIDYLKKVFRDFADFRITLAVLVLWTVLFFIDELVPSEYYRYQECFFRFFMLFFLSSFFIETCFKGKKKRMFFMYFLTGMLSAVLSYLVSYDRAIGGYPVMTVFANNYALLERVRGMMGGYIIILIALTIYFSFRKSGLSFGDYLGRVFSALLPVSIIFVALFLGTAFSWAAAMELFQTDCLEAVLAVPFTLFFIPGCIYALNHVEVEISPTLSFIIKYIINIFSILVILIGYGYILRIFIMREVPSNEIFGILTALFCMSALAWIMNEGYTDGTFFCKAVSFLPYIFAPLILMQIYSVAVRVMEYGFTCGRYVGIMVIIFEIITVLFFLPGFKRRERLLLVLAALTGISVFVPGVNMFHVSDRSQEFFLHKYMQKVENGEELSELEYKRLEGAFKYQKKRIEEAELEKLYGQVAGFIEAEKEASQKKWYYLHGCQMVGEIDTDGFTKMNMLNQSEIYDKKNSDGLKIDFSNFVFYKRETDEQVVIDLSDFYEKGKEYKEKYPDSNKEETSAYLKQINKIQVDDNRVFYINHFEVDYYTEKRKGEIVKKISSVSISGMLLEK